MISSCIKQQHMQKRKGSGKIMGCEISVFNVLTEGYEEKKTWVMPFIYHGQRIKQMRKEFFIVQGILVHCICYSCWNIYLYTSLSVPTSHQVSDLQCFQGRIFRDASLPEVGPAERSALYLAMIETLARLHSFDLRSLGLQGYGRGPGYCRRQVQLLEKFSRFVRSLMILFASWFIKFRLCVKVTIVF